jgi:scyllo-inositol 2-dehydrogenase (NAD+)
MRRYDPAYHQAYEAVQRGDIGTPVVLTAISRDAAPPPRADFLKYSAAGVFIDSGNHDFDLAPWLMQDEVVGVSAVGAVVASHDLADVQPIDFGLATLEFRRGGLGSLQIYRNAVYGYDVRTEVLGTKGAVMVGDPTRQAYKIMHRGRSTQQLTTHWLDRFAEAYRLEMADWVERTIAERPPAIPGEAGVRAVRLALAAEQSRLSGKAVRL